MCLEYLIAMTQKHFVVVANRSPGFHPRNYLKKTYGGPTPRGKPPSHSVRHKRRRDTWVEKRARPEAELCCRRFWNGCVKTSDDGGSESVYEYIGLCCLRLSYFFDRHNVFYVHWSPNTIIPLEWQDPEWHLKLLSSLKCLRIIRCISLVGSSVAL